MKSQTACDAMEKMNEVAEVMKPGEQQKKRSAREAEVGGETAQTLTNDVGDGEEQSPDGNEEQEADPIEVQRPRVSPTIRELPRFFAQTHLSLSELLG